MSDPKLDPCPFCGDWNSELTAEDGKMWVECTSCRARGPSSYYDGDDYGEIAVLVQEQWNQRGAS